MKNLAFKIVQGLSLLLFSFCGLYANAQTGKPARAVELEKTLSREGLELLKGRFPDKPFLLSVKIEPLLRERGGRSSGEKLPYFDVNDEEVVDEWDDPSLSNAALIARVKNIYVNVSIPSELSDDEIAELKSTLVNNLGLLEARDKVEVNKRNWGTLDRAKGIDLKWIGLGAAGWALLMVGFFVIFWFASSKLSKALKESTQSSGKASSSPAPMQSLPIEPVEKKSSVSGSNDLRFNDPIKNRETLGTGMRILEAHRSFPNLEDMMILHKFSVEKPSEMGALMSEFPIEIREKVFALSFGNSWLEALAEPGEVTSACVETLNKCLRQTRNDLETDWQTLLVSVWRLNDKRKEFFRGMSQNEAFSILCSLPKSMALEIAREFFPGAWGMLLDPQYQPTHLTKEQLKAHIQGAQQLEPLRSLKLLVRYKSVREILDFLKTSDPNIEKEVYQVSGEGSLIWSLRSPFYKIFELNQVQLDAVVPLFRIEDWALAMFNISRVERKEIEKRFSDKQRFRYFEILKSFDQQAPTRLRIGEVRERIAKGSESALKEIEAKKLVEQTPPSEQNEIADEKVA
jgi:hypothetical protein